MLLDALAADLGLTPGWQEGMEATSGNDVQLRANGKTISIHFHSLGEGVRVGESEAKAVLWDEDLPLGVTGRLGEVVPSRLVVTSSGAVHLAAEMPIAGGIDGIWTNDPLGAHVTFRKQLDPTSVIHAASTNVHAEMIWTCGESEHWYCYWDGTSAGCYNYYTPTYCNSNDGAGYTPPPSPPDEGGGGPTSPPPKTPQQTQRDLYVNEGCSPIPDESQFLDRDGYDKSGLGNYFIFDAFKLASKDYVLVHPALVKGLSVMTSELDTMSLPGLSNYADGAGYRIPGSNQSTPCGDHCYGTAVDLSIRNSAGAHDCHTWNVLAAAAHAANGWVEPASMIAPGGGVPDHFHVAFDGRTNTDYGDACTN
jgi:hypothetical protein